MKRKVLGIILTLAVLLAGLTGSGLAEGDHGTLYVSFMTGNIRIAINILAQQLGYFKEEGVTVQEVNLGGMDALTAINGDGNLDILGTGFVPDLQAIGNGYDLVVIGGTAVEGGAVIAKEGNAEGFRDAGKIINIDAVLNAKLGFRRNEAAWVITRQYLLDNGVTAEQIAAIEDEASGNILYYADETAVAQAVQKGEVELGFLPLEYALLYADAYGLETVTAAGALQKNYVCCREVRDQVRGGSEHQRHRQVCGGRQQFRPAEERVRRLRDLRYPQQHRHGNLQQRAERTDRSKSRQRVLSGASGGIQRSQQIKRAGDERAAVWERFMRTFWS